MLPLSPHQSQVLSLAYSADSSLLASGDRAGVIQIHNLATGKVTKRIGGEGPVMDLAFSPNGRALAISLGSGVTFFHLESGIESHFVDLRPGGSCRVIFTVDGTVLITNYSLPYILAGKIDSDTEPFREWLTKEKDAVLSMCVSSDQRWLVTGGGRDMQGEVLLWDLQSRELVRSFQHRFTHTYPTYERDYNWELRTYMREEQLNTGHAMAVYAVAISPDSRYVASGGKEGMAKIWDRATSDLLAMHNHESRIVGTQFTQGNDLLLVAEEKGLVHIYDIEGGNLIRTIDQDLGSLSSMIFSPDGMTAAVGSKRGEVLVWDLDY